MPLRITGFGSNNVDEDFDRDERKFYSYDERQEHRVSKPKYSRCSDGFCGADDCPRCRPSNFRGGVLINDENT